VFDFRSKDTTKREGKQESEETGKKESSEITSLMLTKDFFKKVVIRMDVPHHFYDENGILHCSFTDFLLGKGESVQNV